MDYRQFLESTPPEINFRIEGLNQMQEDQLYLVWLAGSLNSYAFHDPKKYPKFKSILPKKTNKSREQELNEEMRRQANAVGLRVP